MSTRPLAPVLVVVGLLVAGAAMIAIPGRATYGARTTADEPQYLLSAISLAEDHDLDISDELAAERWRDFHQVELPRQTEPRADGSELSPHDPLLPLLLAVPVAIGGWVAAKVALALMAGLLAAAMLWVAVRRFGVSVPVAVATVLAFGLAPPLVAYGTQVYPELPAALAVTVAIGALTGPFGRRDRAIFALAVVALPWLAVKYVPVAVGLVLVALWVLARRGDRRPAVVLTGGLGLAGIAFLAFHRAVYGGWTVYASGDYFVGGEFTVVGTSPDYPGRSVRLIGLLVDRGFGLAAWAPVFLLGVAALAALARRRPPGWAVLVVPLALGWANATWVALTMQGWWWPGRQVVVVVPAIVLATAWWIDRHRGVVPALLASGLAGLVLWYWLVGEVLRHQRTFIFDFESTHDPLARAWRTLLPDYRHPTTHTYLLQAAWLVVLIGLAAWGWRSEAGPACEEVDRSDGGAGAVGAGGSAGGDEDALARERADAHVATLDLYGGGAVRR